MTKSILATPFFFALATSVSAQDAKHFDGGYIGGELGDRGLGAD